MPDSDDGERFPAGARPAEFGQLVELVARARAGAGGALLVRGPVGSGVSTLLERLPAASGDVVQLTTAGVASERRIAGAALHRFLLPVDGPGAGGASSWPDPLVATGMLLERLAAAARPGRPVLGRIDDVHLLDGLSRRTFAMAARRLPGLPVAMVLGVRDGDPSIAELDGIRQVVLEPLPGPAARALVLNLLGPPAPAALVDALTELGHGNPMALRELVAAVSPEHRSGARPVPDRLPAGRLRERLLESLRRQSAGVRTLLLVVAAGGTVREPTLATALRRARIPASRLAEAERSALVRVHDGTVRLCDPLLAAAVYDGASSGERRWAHACLADALEITGLVTEAMVHRASAVAGLDPQLACRLVGAAAQAHRDRDYALTSRALERSATLLPMRAASAERLVAAAYAAWEAGEPRRARALLARAEPLGRAGEVRGRAALLLGELELRGGRGPTAFASLAEAARELRDTDRPAALGALVLLAHGRVGAGDHRPIRGVVRQAERLRHPDEGSQTRVLRECLNALESALSERVGDASTGLRRLVGDSRGPEVDPLVWAAETALLLPDDARAATWATEAVRRARARRTVSQVPPALAVLARAEYLGGDRTASRDHAVEAVATARELGQVNTASGAQALLALIASGLGDPEGVVPEAGRAAKDAADRGFSRPLAAVSWAAGRVALAHGRPDEAVRAFRPLLRPALSGAHRALALPAAVDLIEAAVNTGRVHLARKVLTRFEIWIAATDRPVLTALGLRGRALVSDDPDEAVALLGRAVDRLAGTPADLERARTQLLLGAALRRHRRSVLAREPLQEALRTFEGLGAAPWAERTAEELRAAGGTARGAPPAAVEGLTARQRQIATLIAAGATNREVAEQLRLSPRTVDYHLRAVFGHLGIRSRVELVRLLGDLRTGRSCGCC
jgi:DNA-binding CsgD family transcriptional regulator